MYPICYISGRWLQKGPSVHKCHPAIVHIYTKAQSRATEVGSSIGHRKLQTVRNKLPLHPRQRRLGAAAAAVMIVAHVRQSEVIPKKNHVAAVGSVAVDTERNW